MLKKVTHAPPPQPTQAQLLERIEVINASILSWKGRPVPEGSPFYSDKLKPEPRRMTIEYYAGRFYDARDVFERLSREFGSNWPEIIRAIHERVYGSSLTALARECLEETISDHQRGGKLPPFVLMMYVHIRALDAAT